MNERFEFWRKKRVLLTGHTGFKGTWMSLMLEALGAEVCGYALPLSEYSFYKKSGAAVTEHNEGDIADRQALERVVTGFKPEIVIHLASYSSLDGSDKIPDYILQTNIMGVVNLLDISRSLEYIKSIVIVTSDKCYKNLESEKPYTEECELGAEDPYSVSKVGQELITNCYQKTFFEQSRRDVGIATARASNVIGVGDYNISRLMPYLLDSFVNGRTPQIRNPHSIRSWQYVLDVLYGYLLLAEKLYESAGITTQYNGAYNFGPEEDGFVQVGQVAEMVGKRFSNTSYARLQSTCSILKETNILKLDSTKAKTILNWKIQKNLEEAIAIIVDCIKKEKAGVSMADLCHAQVCEYLKGVK
ncbi:MAG: CDP-glucose 4,6-dehydratase [Lachnospiraceae bacterium]|nr:CDP-glucose 4,6-dehydratase [Lachnospiraceae bacterium]